MADAGSARSHRVVALAERREAAADAAATAFDEERLTVAEAAKEATVSEHTIRRAYVHGHLAIQRFGIGQRSLRIKRRDLLKWLEAGGSTAPKPGKSR
jgi:excisionase family DNA binding protein